MGSFQGLTVQHALFTAGVRMGYIHFFFLFSLFFSFEAKFVLRWWSGP
jgi:hypothetical protein